LLQAIADASEDDLRRALSHLQAAEFLYEASIFPDLEYTFKHALTHEVAYGSVLQDRRRRLHARIVHAIQPLYPEPLPPPSHCTLASSRRSRRCTRSGWRSRSNAWRIPPCGANCTSKP